MLRNSGTKRPWLYSAMCVCLSVQGVSAQTYKSLGEYKLSGANAHGIAVDSDSRRLYIAGDDGVTVLNADTGEKLGNVQLKNAQDVLLIPVTDGDKQGASTKGFATGNGSVIEFTLADMKITATEKLPTSGGSSLCYDDDSKTVEVVSAGGSLITINAESGKVVKSDRIATGSGQIACGTLGHVYVADTSGNVIHVLNHRTGKNDGDFPVMSGNRPSGLALDTKGRRLFVACEDGVIEVIDTDSGFTFIELKGGVGPARETFAWTPQGRGQWKAASFVVQHDGTLIGVRMNAYINYTVGGQYKLTPGLDSIAYDAKTHHLFITAMHSSTPVVVVAGY